MSQKSQGTTRQKNRLEARIEAKREAQKSKTNPLMPDKSEQKELQCKPQK
jgi:hypothetical protein